MTRLAQHILDGATENNVVNDGKYSDWSNVADIFEYSETWGGFADSFEIEKVKEFLGKLILINESSKNGKADSLIEQYEDLF